MAVPYNYAQLIESGYFPVDSRHARNHNVCKTLRGNVLVYAIFVDTKASKGWTNFDINSTIDSIYKAIDWIHQQARKNNIELSISFDHFAFESGRTIEKNLGDQISKVVQEQEGVLTLEKWGDKVVRTANDEYKNKEQLIAQLRDKYNVESVALLFMLNNYYKDDASLSINTMSNELIEFTITSYKNPSEIAHEVFHLFGAADLYYHKIVTKRNYKSQLKQMFPNDIMANPKKHILKLEVGEITKYLIGWTNTIEDQYIPFFKEKKTDIRPGRQD